jgi:hypothetical protein
MIIAHTLGIHTHNVETGRGWTSEDGKRAWAFLAVGSEADGTALIKRIGTLLGQPFWMWHTTDLLEGSYVVPATSATTYLADIAAEETEGSFPVLGLVQVSRLLPPVFLDPDTLD